MSSGAEKVERAVAENGACIYSSEDMKEVNVELKKRRWVGLPLGGYA